MTFRTVPFVIAYLDDETAGKFKSDFKFVVDYVRQMQQTGDYIYDRMVFWAMIFLAAVTVLMDRVHKMIEEDLRIARHLAGKRKATP